MAVSALLRQAGGCSAFTLAASSVMSAEGPVHSNDAVAKFAEEICKASRITAEGALNIT